MARPVRIQLAGATYLVQIRARPDSPLFAGGEDRSLFLDALAEAAPPHKVQIFAWALMDHSVLLLLRSGPLPLWRFVHRVQAGYFNRLRRIPGKQRPELRDRHRAILIEEEPYFASVLRRVHLAPVIGGDWSGQSEARRWGEVVTNRWTSWSQYTEEEDVPEWFDRDGALEHFAGGSRAQEEEFYRYVMAGAKHAGGEDVLDRVVAMCLLGSEAFVEQYYEGAKGRRRLSKPKRLKGRGKLFRRIVRMVADHFACSPEDIIKARSRHPGRKFVVELAMRHALDGGGVKRLGERLHVSGSALAHLRRDFRQQLERQRELAHLLEHFEKQLHELDAI